MDAPYGVIIGDEMLTCAMCALGWGLTHPDELTTYEEVSQRGYPDGYTCAICGDVFPPIPERNDT